MNTICKTIEEGAENGKVRNINGGIEVWIDAFLEMISIHDKLRREGCEVQIVFFNEVNEVTPNNKDKSLFYFRLRARKVALGIMDFSK